MENQKKLSIVIPVYNEAKTIHEILNRVLKVELNYGFEKEIILVNDSIIANSFQFHQNKNFKFVNPIRNIHQYSV